MNPAHLPVATVSPADSSGTPSLRPRGCSNFKLRQLSRVASRHYDAHMAAATGLKTSQFSLLGHIHWLQPVQPAELAARMALEPSTLTRNLQPLVAQGWVTVGPGPDARSRRVQLTPEGQAKHEQARDAWKQAQQAFNARVGLDRVVRLHALLDECLALLDEESPAGGAVTDIGSGAQPAR